jgi:hypothetical protein
LTLKGEKERKREKERERERERERGGSRGIKMEYRL